MRSFALASAVAGLASTVAAQLPPIHIYGTKFYYENGTQFFIKGVAYQEDYNGGAGTGSGSSTQGNGAYTDPLSIPSNCERDIPYLQELETNVIRVYAIDPTLDHSECMTMMANAGIYVFADLAAPVQGESINSIDPQWDDQLYARYTSVVDALQNYTNVIGFFAGNEVSDQPNNTNAMPFVKAAVRDTKAYIKRVANRPIYVGYAADDDQYIRVPLSEFMICGEEDAAVDFWGYNIYEWCGIGPTFETSGYQARTEEFSSYAAPAFFAEYGCITPGPRTFDDTPVLLGPLMDTVWSGGIVYQYFQTTNDYGLVNISSSNSVIPLSGFTTLSSQIRKASPTGTSSADYTPSNTAWSCPTENADWEASSPNLPPSPNNQACTCLYNSLGCVASNNLQATDYATYFGDVCGLDNGKYCEGILANGTTGQYGAWSMCDPEQQLSYVFNVYYLAQGSSSSACSFNGAASVQSAQSPSGTCASLIAQAGSAGTGTVAAPTATGTNVGSPSSGSSKSAGHAKNVPSPVSGLLPAAVLVVVSLLSGAGMMLL